MRVLKMFEQAEATYSVQDHPAVYSAQHLAEETHTHGCNVLKPVVVRVDGRTIMTVIPADHRLDFDKLLHAIGSSETPRLVPENEFPDLFEDADVGAECPIGELYGMETIMEESLHNGEHDVVFLFGSHRRAIRMPVTEFVRVVAPTLAPISTHL